MALNVFYTIDGCGEEPVVSILLMYAKSQKKNWLYQCVFMRSFFIAPSNQIYHPV